MSIKLRTAGIAMLCLAGFCLGALRARHCQFNNHTYKTTGMGNHIKAYVIDAEADYVSGDTSFFEINSPGSMGHILIVGADTPSVTLDHIKDNGDSVWACTDSFLIRDKNGDRTKWRPEFKGTAEIGAVSNLEYGVWEDYDSVTGFDEVAADAKAPTEVPAIAVDGKSFVDNEFWIDSIGEVWPFPAWVPTYIADTSVATGGYMIMAYGQIRIDKAGKYVFVTSGRYDGTQVWFDFDSDDQWDDLDWVQVPPSYLSDTLRFEGIGSNPRVASAELEPGHYRIKMYFWQWGSQNSNSYLAWKRPDAEGAVVVPAEAFGEPRAKQIPVATIAKITKNGTTVSEDLATTECASDTWTFTGELLREPDNAKKLTYYWDFGDGTTLKSNDATVTKVFSSPGNHRVSLIIDYGGDFPTRTARTSKIQVASCQPVGVAGRTPGVPREAIGFRLEGNTLTVWNPTEQTATLTVHSLGGRRILCSPLGKAAATSRMSLDMSRGTYLLKVQAAGVSTSRLLVVP